MSGNEENNDQNNEEKNQSSSSSSSIKSKTPPSPLKKFFDQTKRSLRSGGKIVEIALDARKKFGGASRSLFNFKSKKSVKKDEKVNEDQVTEVLNLQTLEHIDEAKEASEENILSESISVEPLQINVNNIIPENINEEGLNNIQEQILPNNSNKSEENSAEELEKKFIEELRIKVLENIKSRDIRENYCIVGKIYDLDTPTATSSQQFWLDKAGTELTSDLENSLEYSQYLERSQIASSTGRESVHNQASNVTESQEILEGAEKNSEQEKKGTINSEQEAGKHQVISDTEATNKVVSGTEKKSDDCITSAKEKSVEQQQQELSHHSDNTSEIGENYSRNIRNAKTPETTERQRYERSKYDKYIKRNTIIEKAKSEEDLIREVEYSFRNFNLRDRSLSFGSFSRYVFGESTESLQEGLDKNPDEESPEEQRHKSINIDNFLRQQKAKLLGQNPTEQIKENQAGASQETGDLIQFTEIQYNTEGTQTTQSSGTSQSVEPSLIELELERQENIRLRAAQEKQSHQESQVGIDIEKNSSVKQSTQTKQAEACDPIHRERESSNNFTENPKTNSAFGINPTNININLNSQQEEESEEEVEKEEMDYLTVKKVIRDIKPLENTPESYTTFIKSCKFAHDALKFKFSTHSQMEKCFIDQLALLTSSNIQGAVHGDTVTTFEQFLEILRNAHGYTKMSVKLWHQLASFQPKQGETLRALKLRLNGISGNYKSALKEEGKSDEQIENDVKAVESKIVQVIPQYLPSPFNQLMATENITTMEQFQKFLDKHGEVNYGDKNSRSATCLAIREVNSDKELAIIEILQESLKSIDLTVANAQRESEKKLSALNERISKWDAKFNQSQENGRQQGRSQEFNNNRPQNNNYQPRNFNYNTNYSKSREDLSNNREFRNKNGNNFGNRRDTYSNRGSGYNNTQNNPRRNNWNNNGRNYHDWNDRFGKYGPREYSQNRSSPMSASCSNLNAASNQRNVSFNDNVEAFPFKGKN